MSDTFIAIIASICHQANKAWCEANGDFSQSDWTDAPEWQKTSAVNGVQFKLDNPTSTPEDSHDSWYAEKMDNGWVYGPVKDVEAKKHPCMVPYAELPEFQRKKDALFQAIVVALI